MKDDSSINERPDSFKDLGNVETCRLINYSISAIAGDEEKKRKLTRKEDICIPCKCIDWSRELDDGALKVHLDLSQLEGHVLGQLFHFRCHFVTISTTSGDG